MPPAAIGQRAGQRSLLRWTASLLALAGLVVGIPMALIAFRLMPPFAQLAHVVASPGTAERYLDHSVTNSEVVGSVSCAAWIVWLWLCICVSIETVAAVRGRPTFHLPASRHIQGFVTGLVGASLAIIPLGRDGLPMRLYVAPTAFQATGGSGRLVDRSVLESRRWTSSEVLSTETGRAPLIDADDGMPEPASAADYVVHPGDTPT